MEETDGFGEFVAIVQAGSVSAAARKLGVPRATLSRRLSRLEQRLGVRLVHRTTRHLSLSLAGQELYRRAARIQQEAREAEAAVRRLDDVPRGLLRVSVPPLGGAGPMAEALTSFLEAWPEVELQVSANLRHVDLAREGFDVAMRAGRIRDPALISRRIFTGRRVVFAARERLDAHGPPSSVADLDRFDCVRGYDPVTGLPHAEWPLVEGGSVRVTGRLSTNDLALTLADILQNGSLGLLPEQIVMSRVGPDVLVPVLEEQVGDEASISAVYLDRTFLDPKVRAFVDHMVVQMPARLERVQRGDDGVAADVDGMRGD